MATKRALSIDIMQTRRAIISVFAIALSVVVLAAGACAGIAAAEREALVSQETDAGSLYRSAHLEASRHDR